MPQPRLALSRLRARSSSPPALLGLALANFCSFHRPSSVSWRMLKCDARHTPQRARALGEHRSPACRRSPVLQYHVLGNFTLQRDDSIIQRECIASAPPLRDRKLNAKTASATLRGPFHNVGFGSRLRNEQGGVHGCQAVLRRQGYVSPSKKIAPESVGSAETIAILVALPLDYVKQSIAPVLPANRVQRFPDPTLR
jgi:hypothetical protein